LQSAYPATPLLAPYRQEHAASGPLSVVYIRNKDCFSFRLPPAEFLTVADKLSGIPEAKNTYGPNNPLNFKKQIR